MTDTIKDKFEHIGWRFKNRMLKIKQGAIEKGGLLLDWVIDNPGEAVAVGGLIVTGLKASQSLVVSHRHNKERRRIDYTYYDPSSGFHWDLRRKATNNDRREITRRKQLGEDTFTILNDLRLI